MGIKKSGSILLMIFVLSLTFFWSININAATQFSSGFESGQTQLTWVNTIDWSTNVTGYLSGINPECATRTGEQSHGGSVSLMFSGTDNNTTTSYCYFKVFDVNIAITSTMQLSYWFYPQVELARHVALDFICTDGSTLRDSGAVDQNGIKVHPSNARGTINTWNQVVTNFGSKLNGKTIDRILVAYDYGPSTGQFRGYVDDITISDNGSIPTPTPPTATPTSTPMVTPTPMPTPTPSTGGVVGKIFAGYQGWFNCSGDGSPNNCWIHWSKNNNAPAPGNINVEIYPDIREYSKLYQTGFANLGNGQPAKLFSSYDQETVNKHFEWMQTYNIDGAALQRFGAYGSWDNWKTNRDSVAVKVKNAAQTYGRQFYVMYDITGMPSNTWYTDLQNDWTTNVVNKMALTASSAYARQNGKLVVCIWGMGFTDRPGDVTQCTNVINWFKNQGCYVIGGVPTNWRTGTSDSKSGFLNVYKSFNMISPWSVGRFGNISGANSFKTNQLQPDFTYCQQNGIDYQPVMFPGFAWNNMHNGDSNYPRNQIPRVHGDFLWQQAYNIKSLGISTGYVAMFDEYDEGTAIAKGSANSSMVPTNQYFLTYDAEGTACSSDFYLRLVNDINRMFKNQISLTTTHPTSHQ